MVKLVRPRVTHGALPEEAVTKPQEIDGKGSENLPLCRNRDTTYRLSGELFSRNASPGASLNTVAMHHPTDNT